MSIFQPKPNTHRDKYKSRIASGQDARLQREKIFVKQKEDYLKRVNEEKQFEELEECTFEPDREKTKLQSDNQRDFNQFLNDQQKFLEYKSMNNLRAKALLSQDEIQEVKLNPKLDDLSQQIVNLMEDRRQSTTHDRLYATGRQKLREKNAREQLEKSQLKVKIDKRSASPNLRSSINHRGRPIQSALYDLAPELQRQKQELQKQKEFDDYMKRNTKFANKESQNLAIDGFKKEFRSVLLEVYNQDQIRKGHDPESQIDPKQHVLDFNRVALIMHQLGFLQSKLSNEQEEQLSDLYTLFKCSKDQKILAENLQNVLMVISGLRHESFEVPNQNQNTKWMNSGVYEEDSGLFYLRQGESNLVQMHFTVLKLNRLQQKKAVNNFSHKNASEIKPYQPKINKKSDKLAKEHREKIFSNAADQIDVVQILLDPRTLHAEKMRKEQLKAQLQAQEDAELTLMPKTLQKTNQRLLANKKRNVYGDRNQELYRSSKQHEKTNKESEEYYFERQANECKFQPDTHKNTSYLKSGSIPGSVHDVPHVEKTVERLTKAREERDFKKIMTERSGYSPIRGQNSARADIDHVKEKIGGSTLPKTAIDKSIHKKPVAERKGAAINPYKKQKEGPAQPPQQEQKDNESSSSAKELIDKQLDEIGDRIDERDPKLYVDVNIGKNQMERIVVYEGDTADSLTQKFCEKHNLSDDMKVKLKSLLEQQIAGVLPKIVEDEDISESEH